MFSQQYLVGNYVYSRFIDSLSKFTFESEREITARELAEKLGHTVEIGHDEAYHDELLKSFKDYLIVSLNSILGETKPNYDLHIINPPDKLGDEGKLNTFSRNYYSIFQKGKVPFLVWDSVDYNGYHKKHRLENGGGNIDLICIFPSGIFHNGRKKRKLDITSYCIVGEMKSSNPTPRPEPSDNRKKRTYSEQISAITGCLTTLFQEPFNIISTDIFLVTPQKVRQEKHLEFIN